MSSPFWQHQVDGIDYLDRNRGGLLMMGVGTGKTLTALEFIQRKTPLNVLIVGTKKGAGVWAEQALQHGYSFPVHVITEGAIKTRGREIQSLMTSKSTTQHTNIFVISYEALSRKAMMVYLLQLSFQMLIFDEVHRLRGYATNQSKNAWALAKRNPSAYRLGLTGTIIYNRPLDVFGIYRFIDPNLFGTKWNNFKFRYAVWGGQFGQIPLYYINQDELKAKVQANAHIVDRHKVLDLPDEQHIIRRTAFAPAEAKAYKDFDREFIAYLADRTKITAVNVLDKVLKLQQLTGGFMYKEGLTISFSSAKLELLETLLDEIGEQNVVIFYKFKEEARLIADLLTRLNVPYFSVNGQSNQYNEWRSHDQPAVLVTQVQSGSESLDFTKASVTIFYSLIYSYGQYEQALGRTSRANQKSRSIAYYYLLIENSIDEKIWKALQDKKDLIQDILTVAVLEDMRRMRVSI